MFDRDNMTIDEALDILDGMKEIGNKLNNVVNIIDEEISVQTNQKVISLYRELKEMIEQSIHDSCIQSAIADLEENSNQDECEETDASLRAWHHSRVL